MKFIKLWCDLLIPKILILISGILNVRSLLASIYSQIIAFHA